MKRCDSCVIHSDCAASEQSCVGVADSDDGVCFFAVLDRSVGKKNNVISAHIGLFVLVPIFIAVQVSLTFVEFQLTDPF